MGINELPHFVILTIHGSRKVHRHRHTYMYIDKTHILTLEQTDIQTTSIYTNTQTHTIGTLL